MGLGQSPFKMNHSTVGFRPIPIQEESLNNGVRPIPVQEESFNSGVRPIPVQEESLNSGARANPNWRRLPQQWGSGQSPFKKNHSIVGLD